MTSPILPQLRAALRFISEERENREHAGGDASDYVGEAMRVEDGLAGAIEALEHQAAALDWAVVIQVAARQMDALCAGAMAELAKTQERTEA